ncbi:hypothetical protein RIF29_41350 [Crotalaria pallida]|uniref:NADP-dependent oxidoreductase domain-containing protein n=1 Tax=Crotalaria pallida TaxID=3830 RepID=A0AAN9HSL4_CROPI
MPAAIEIPTVVLKNTSSQVKVPVIGMGSAPDFTCKKDAKDAFIEAIKQGYRHFDTAAAYGSEHVLGEALKEAFQLGLVTRDELFITSKLWVTNNHPHLLVPALRESLRGSRALQLEYLDLYLIHWPLSSKPGKFSFPIDAADLLPFDVKGGSGTFLDAANHDTEKGSEKNEFKLVMLKSGTVMSALGYDIGPSILHIRPGQSSLLLYPFLQLAMVKMNLAWQQKELRKFCDANGVTFVAKSYHKERMNQNLQIFDWELTEEDHKKISQIKHNRLISGSTKPQLHDLFDDEI